MVVKGIEDELRVWTLIEKEKKISAIQHADRGLNNGPQQETKTTRKYPALELLEQLDF